MDPRPAFFFALTPKGGGPRPTFGLRVAFPYLIRPVCMPSRACARGRSQGRILTFRYFPERDSMTTTFDAPPLNPGEPATGTTAPRDPVRKSGLFRAFWRWHFYASVLVIPVFALLSVTG